MKKKILSIVLAIVMVVGMVPMSVSVFAGTTADGLVYEISGGTATAVGYTGDADTIVIPEEIDGCPVTAIGEWAFDESRVVSVVLPETISEIGEGAFSRCRLLEDINLPCGITQISASLFYYCISLREVNIPAGVKSIGNSAFNGCSDLVSITLPESVEKIGNSAFYECSKLVSFTVPEGVKLIDDNAFAKCKSLESISIPESVTSIGNEAFYRCTALNTVNYGADARAWEKVSVGAENDPLLNAEFIFTEAEYEIPAGLTYVINDGEVTITGYTGYASRLIIPDMIESCPVVCIDGYAFQECYSLYNVTLPGTLKVIARGAFSQCENLSGITIPNGVTTIDREAFDGCEFMEYVKIPKSVTYIGPWAFNECYGLTGVYIEDIAAWCNISFNGSAYNPLTYAKNLYVGDVLVKEITIPEGITNIGQYTFRYCENIEKVNLPESLESIGMRAFNGCTSLKSINIPDSVTAIGEEAFDGCVSLESIHIPAGVTKIETDTFDGCTSLKTVTGLESIKALGSGAFGKCAIESITLPEGLTTIGGGAFYFCQNLKTITIPKSLTKIESNAFDCAGLETVYYGGVEADWEKISIASYNEPLLAANIIFAKNESNVPEGLEYTIENGEVTITGYTGSAQYLVIPEKIEGCPVTIIGFKAFYNCAGLVNVDIPKTVYKIDNMAFYGCTSLESIAISKNVTEINYMAFNNCTALEAVYIEDLEAWCNIYFASPSTNPLSFAKHLYINGELAKEIVIPESITAVGDYTFYNSSVEKVTVMGEITAVGKMAFAYCTSLESIELFEKGVTSIGNSAFYGCTALKGIVIPEGIESIGEYTFGSCTSLESVIIPEGVKSIGNFAFEYCISLREITIPKTVASVGFLAFNNCRGLEAVIFGGSSEDFANIMIDAGNTRLTDARINYLTAIEILAGDINGDGEINSIDSNMFKRFIAGVLVPTTEQMKAGDVDGDGELTSFDSNLLSRIISGKI